MYKFTDWSTMQGRSEHHVKSSTSCINNITHTGLNILATMASGSENKPSQSRLPTEFKLERYFAKYEFNPRVKHLMCCSDVEPLSMSELVAMADEETRGLWDNLTLGYTESPGHPQLRREAGKLHDVGEEDVLVVCPQEGIFLAMNCLVDLAKRESGQGTVHAVATFPGYQSLFENLKTCGVDVSYWMTQFVEGKGWRFDVNDLRALIREDTNILVVNFPHNPTGFLPTEAMWLDILQLCRENNLYLFSDEMYRFAINDKSGVLTSACAAYERAITLFGMSKTFALPGLRIGWVCTRNAELMAMMQSFKDYTTICSPAPSEILALIGLRNSARLIERTLAINKKSLNALEAFAAEFPELLEWHSPAGGTTGLLNLKRPLISKFGGAEEFCKQLVDEVGVLLVSGSCFEFGDNCVRVGFGRKNIPEAIGVLGSFLTRI